MLRILEHFPNNSLRQFSAYSNIKSPKCFASGALKIPLKVAIRLCASLAWFPCIFPPYILLNNWAELCEFSESQAWVAVLENIISN